MCFGSQFFFNIATGKMSTKILSVEGGYVIHQTLTMK